MKGVESLQVRRVDVSEGAPVYIVEVFYRLFKIGIYYPLGHVVLDQAAGKFIQQLRETFPACNTIRLEVEKDRLLLEKMVLPHAAPFIRDLHALLASLGIGTLLIERTISHKQLLQFVRSILAWRVQLQNTGSSLRFKIADLPESIKVTERQYPIDKQTGVVADSEPFDRQKIEEICAVLGKQGLSEVHVRKCRDFLVKLSAQEKEKKIELQGFPNATWLDVQNLLHTAVMSTSSSKSRETVNMVERDVNVLTSIFASLARGLDSKKEKETISLLVSHLSGMANSKSWVSEGSQTAMTGLGKTEKPVSEISATALQQFVNDNRMASKILENLSTIDRRETLSILFQLLHATEKQKLTERCEQMLATILRSPLSARGWAVLLAGNKHFVDDNTRDRFHKLLRMILVVLRESPSVTSCEFLVDLWNGMPNTLHPLLWPYAVNELLVVGMAREKKHFYELTEIVCHMHPETMKSLRPHLEALDAFRVKKVAPIIFRPSYIYAYPFFAFLFETSLGDLIADNVLAELQNDPQDAFMEAVGPILRVANPDHLQLLGSYLKYAQNEALPAALKTAAGQIILDFLENISEDQKELPWLEKTIRAMAELQIMGTEEFLERISSERRFAVVPAWSRECRKAAEDALQLLTSRQVPKIS